jgi:GNAT superfamily N-acetyltransferase
VARYRTLYDGVGEDYHWVDRREWTDAQLQAHLARSDVEVLALLVAGVDAGWFELAKHPDGSVEIAYFGVIPSYHGRGLGKHLLTEAVGMAWRRTDRRVWLHTCTLDSPAAMPNYLARGFRAYRQETYFVGTD